MGVFLRLLSYQLEPLYTSTLIRFKFPYTHTIT
jgi:hypothetical protein